MKITIPDDILRSAGLTEDGLMVEIAVMLYAQERIGMGRACRLCGMPRLRFQHVLASRRIEVHYDAQEVDHDLAVSRDEGWRKD